MQQFILVGTVNLLYDRLRHSKQLVTFSPRVSSFRRRATRHPHTHTSTQEAAPARERRRVWGSLQEARDRPSRSGLSTALTHKTLRSGRATFHYPAPFPIPPLYFDSLFPHTVFLPFAHAGSTGRRYCLLPALIASQTRCFSFFYGI